MYRCFDSQMKQLRLHYETKVSKDVKKLEAKPLDEIVNSLHEILSALLTSNINAFEAKSH